MAAEPAMKLGAIPRYIDELEERGGLKGADIANITDVSRATVSRWRSGAIKPQPKNELILSDLHYIVGRLCEYYSGDEIRTWLYARHPQLEGQRAIDLIHQERAIDVLKVIDRLDGAVYL
jgi:transcriptional regulator with XRE-family HTH domain